MISYISAVKSWKKFQSGIGHKCGSYSSVKLGDRQNALHGGNIVLSIVQNAGSVGVRDGKNKTN